MAQIQISKNPPNKTLVAFAYAPLIGYIVLEKSRLESKNNSFWYNNLNQHCRLWR